MALGRLEPIFALRTKVKEVSALAEEKASSPNEVKPVFSRSKFKRVARPGSEPAGRLPFPVILRLVRVEMEDNSDGITAGTPGKVRMLITVRLWK